MNLGRMSAAARHAEHVDDVLLVFVATHPSEGGQRVVGWYRNSRVFREEQPDDDPRRGGCSFFASAPATDATLLPVDRRTWRVPVGPGGMKRTHVRYALDRAGHDDQPTWLVEIVQLIDAYTGPNAMLGAGLDEAAVEEAVEVELAKQGRAGFCSDPAMRRAIEKHAMAAATAYYGADGWTVRDHSARAPYDLMLEQGDERWRVEVKGTTGDGSEVILTRGEVESARSHASALFILHSIQVEVDEDGVVRAAGGEETVFDPWEIDAGELIPVSFFYRPPAR